MSQSRFLLLLLLVLVLLAYGAQFLIDFRAENLATASIVAASSMVILLYLLWTPAIQTHPLSTFAIFGFNVTTQFGALLAQSFTGNSVATNLRQPIETFATLAFYQAIALSAHMLYRHLAGRSDQDHRPSGLIRLTLERLKLYATPSVGTLWLMGLFGLFNIAIGGGESVGSKVSQGVIFLAWAPFLIPMYVLQEGPKYCRARLHYIFVIFHFAAIAFLAIAANARGMMLSGIVTVMLFALLTIMRSKQRIKATHIGGFVVLALVAGIAYIPASDLVTAMGLARGQRQYASATKMIENTYYYFTQSQLIEAEQARARVISLREKYDETYFPNSLIGRLVETKFHDNALYFAANITPKDRTRLLDTTGDLLWATLPQPMLDWLGIGVQKKDLQFSMGDYLSHLAGAGGLGSFRTGSAFAQGIALFGIAFPAVYFLMCLVLFLAIDLLSYKNKSGRALVSALGMLGIWRMFQYGISAESLQHLFIAVVRGVPQNIALYLIVFHVARMFVSIADRWRLPGRQALVTARP